MIVKENMLGQMIEGIPEVSLNNSNVTKSPSFGWGTKETLDRYIQKAESNCYPLVWLLPSEEIENRKANILTSNCVFIIATLEVRTELFNGSRLLNSFDKTLNPLAEYVKKGVELSNNMRIVNADSVRQFKHPNYSETNEEDGGTIDKWDALKLEFEIEFTDNCYKQIQWI